MERRNIACCLPGLSFSNVWVSNWTSLLSHLQGKFNVQVMFGYSNNIYITRNTILKGLFDMDRQGQELDLVLWMDDDNILTPEQFDQLYSTLTKNPRVDGAMGWYWLQPHGYQVEPIVSCGQISEAEDSACIPIRPNYMYMEPWIELVEYGGMGSVLFHWDSLKEVGENSFSPVILPKSAFGFAGDDVAFFIRAKELQQRYVVDKRVKLPHLKLRDADFDSSQFVDLPEEVKPALNIQGWMRNEELLWLYQKAKGMNSIIEIGSWKGKSSTALLAGCKGIVTCIDHWQGASDLILATNKTLNEEAKENDIHAEFLRNVERFDNMACWKMPSLEAAPYCSSVDMVFIDASHEFEDVVKDLEAWQGKANKLLCGHDLDREDVKRALKFKGIPYQRGPGTIWFYEVGKAA